MTIELTNTCPYYGISRATKNVEPTEVGQRLIENFEDMGCYECKGIDISCPKYISPKEEYEKFFIIIKEDIKDSPYY